MVRTQIQLPEEQLRRLRRVARAQGVSLAEVIRRCIERALEAEGEPERWRRALALAGAFADRHGARDVAERHDDYLTDPVR